MELMPPSSPSSVITLASDRLKQRIQFVQPTLGGEASVRDRDMIDVLDALKVTDFVMFIVSAKEEVDEAGERLLSQVMAQGVPSCFSVVQVNNEFINRNEFDYAEKKSKLIEQISAFF